MRPTSHRFLRCLALAQAWIDAGNRALFVVGGGDRICEARLTAEEIDSVVVAAISGSSEDARQTIQFAEQWEADWVVVDGPGFTADYQIAVREAGFRVALLDDEARGETVDADLVVNSGLCAEESLYPDRRAETRLLLGPRYALLRREFARWASWRRTVPEVASKVLVSFTGPELAEYSVRAIDCLAQLRLAKLEGVVIAPPGSAQDENLKTEAAGAPFRVRLRPNFTAMPSLLAWADAAVTGSEMPSNEWLLMGLPSLIVVPGGQHRPQAERIASLGIGVILGGIESLDTRAMAKRLKTILTSWDDREAMSRTCRSLVDGEGTQRVLQRLLGDRIRIRRTRADDCELLWNWTNDPHARASASDPRPVDWDSHVHWLRGKLEDARSYLFMGLDRDDAPVGTMEFEITGSAANVHLIVAPQARGEGLGVHLLDLGASYMFRNTWVERILATAKADNPAAMKMFRKAGFKSVGEEETDGQKLFRLVLPKSPDVGSPPGPATPK